MRQTDRQTDTIFAQCPRSAGRSILTLSSAENALFVWRQIYRPTRGCLQRVRSADRRCGLDACLWLSQYAAPSGAYSGPSLQRIRTFAPPPPLPQWRSNGVGRVDKVQPPPSSEQTTLIGNPTRKVLVSGHRTWPKLAWHIVSRPLGRYFVTD